MTSKLLIVSLLILTACSGSSAGPIGDSVEPNTYVTQPPEPPTPASKVAAEDSGTPVETVTDAGQDSGQDAGVDASQVDSGGQDASVDAAVIPRFGVNFTGAADSALSSPLPSDLAGKSELTYETWFRLNAASDRGLIFHGQQASCAVTTTGPQTGTIHCCNWYAGNSTCVTGAALASLGTWRHVAWVLSAGTWTLYVDGQKQGDVPSTFAAHPTFFAGAPFRFGSELGDSASVVGTVDEFRLSYSALYTVNFTPPKHLDAAGAVNLLLDDGVGTTSGPATLLAGSSWLSVSR